MELSGYTIEQLIELRDNISNYIQNREDGFIYITKIHSYGRSYDLKFSNLHTAMELCDRYTGDDGIAELYTNNPDVTGYVYGGIYIINSKEEYDKAMQYRTLKNLIRESSGLVEQWEKRDTLPFYSRPKFEPFITKEELEEYKKELEILEKEVVEPKLVAGSDNMFDGYDDYQEPNDNDQN